MPVIEPVVSESKLRDLLDEGHESPGLDYKQSLDPNDTRAWVELAKDVGAMQAEGGFIVIGADDHGTPVGVSQGDLAKFDESPPKPCRYWFEPTPPVWLNSIRGSPMAMTSSSMT